MKKNFGLIIFLTCCYVISPVSAAENSLKISASIPPLAFIVEQIGGENVHVFSVIDQNGDPHTYSPTPKQAVEMGQTKLFFTIGVPFEQTLKGKIENLNNPPMIIDTTKGVKFRQMEHDHSHHGGHDDHEGTMDPHIWLGPAALKIIAGNICDGLVAADAANAAEYKNNYRAFCQKIDDLTANISRMLLPFKGKKVFVFHPSFGYFTDAFDLKQEAVEIEGKSPSPRQIINLITEAKQDQVKVIFVQPQFDSKAAANIAKGINGSVVPLNPLEKNVFKNLEDMARKIAAQ